MLPLAAVECPAGCAWMTLSVVADAPKVVLRSVGKENVCTQIEPLAPCPQGARPKRAEERSIAASIVTSTSASFGTGLLVDSEPSRAYPQDTRRRSCRSHKGEHCAEQMAPWGREQRAAVRVGVSSNPVSWGTYESLVGAEFSCNVLSFVNLGRPANRWLIDERRRRAFEIGAAAGVRLENKKRHTLRHASFLDENLS